MSLASQITAGFAAVATAVNAKVAKTTTVNGHALSANVTVSASDIGLGDVLDTKVAVIASTDPDPTPGSNPGVIIVLSS